MNQAKESNFASVVAYLHDNEADVWSRSSGAFAGRLRRISRSLRLFLSTMRLAMAARRR